MVSSESVLEQVSVLSTDQTKEPPSAEASELVMGLVRVEELELVLVLAKEGELESVLVSELGRELGASSVQELVQASVA